MKKCKGYMLTIQGTIFENFQFQQLKHDFFVMENGTLPDKKCYENNYQILDEEPQTCDVNICCSNFASSKIVNIVRSGNNAKKHLSTTKNEFLTYQQLCRRIQHLQDVLNSEKLKSLNRCRKIERLNKSLELHQRFMMVIKDNYIPKLHEIVKVAISSKRS